MRYVALLRGIAPMNPNMRNEQLRGVFEKLGFENVQTVLSSGNVVFDSPNTNGRALEETIEKALPEELGFTSTTILRSQEQLQRLIDKDPFAGLEHSQKTSLNVTFVKRMPETDIEFPYQDEGLGYILLGNYDGAILSVLDLTNSKAPRLMSLLERKIGKEITTRTWKTVERILKVMG